MTLLEIIQAAKQNNSEAFGSVADKRAQAIVRATLLELANQVKVAKHDEKIAVASFGTFIIKEKEIDRDGDKSIGRRVTFKSFSQKSEQDVEVDQA